MITRLFESLIVGFANPLLDKAQQRRARHQKPALTDGPPADGQVLLGQVRPVPSAHSFPHPLPGQASPSSAFSLSSAARRRHLYAIGSTGCGKTNFLLRLIEADIAAGHSFCVIDLRGDLVDRILLRLAQTKDPEAAGKRLLLLDLRQQEHSVGFNPLTGTGDAYNRAFHTLDVLRQQADSWGIQLEETLRNALLALAETGWSLTEVEPLLCEPAFREQVLSSVTDSQVRSFFLRYGQLTADKQATWRLPVLNKITPLLAIPSVRLMLGQRQGISFPDLLDKRPGQIVLISLAVDRLHGAAHLVGGLLVSALQTAIMARVDQPEKERVPVNLYIDEFETMATERFETILAEGRRFGLGLTLSHQNLSQLPQALRHAVLTNAQTQLYFQTGATDATELAREVTCGQPREWIRTALVGQAVGEAFLVRRGQESVHLKVAHCPDPKAGPANMDVLRSASFAAFALPRPIAEREIQEREAWRLSLGDGVPAPAQATAPGRRKKTSPTVAPPTILVPTITPPTVQTAGSEETGSEENSPSGEHSVPEPPRPAPTYEIRHGKTGHFKPKQN